MSKFYSDDERIIRVWDKEIVKDLLARRQVCEMNNDRRTELETLWVREPQNRATASFGSNWGYYVGMDEISAYYVVKHEEDLQAELNTARITRPELRDIRDNFGYGSYINHHASTPYIVLAGDGKTAKGMWYSIGTECHGQEDGSVQAMWYLERICADFIKESDGEWKIWHLIVSNDCEYEAGTSVGEVYSFPEPGQEILPQNEFGTPTFPYVVHNRSYGWSDNYPALPTEYETYDPATGYGYEGRPKWHRGHPNYRKEWK